MFEKVKENSNRQDEKFKALKSDQIEDYYPELNPEHGEKILCTMCSHLIPDLMRHQRVLIDLDNLKTEDDLIQRYGVNRSFLETLIEKERVVIATNLNPLAHESNTWMHGILAREETLFKEARTANFFRAQFIDIDDVRIAYQDEITEVFESLSEHRYLQIISNMDVPPRNAPRRDAAKKLAWDIVRVNALMPNLGEEAIELTPSYVLSNPDENVRALYVQKFLSVSPHSGALGGTMLVPDTVMKNLFIDASLGDVLRTGVIQYEPITQYLAGVSSEFYTANVHGAEYWQRITDYEKDQLLDLLSDEEERKRHKAAELNLRLRIARGDADVTEEEIREIIERDIRLIERFEIAKWGISFVTGWYLNSIDGAPAWLGPAVNLAGNIIAKGVRPIVEFAVPRIQVANYVRSKRAKRER